MVNPEEKIIYAVKGEYEVILFPNKEDAKSLADGPFPLPLGQIARMRYQQWLSLTGIHLKDMKATPVKTTWARCPRPEKASAQKG